MKYKDVLQKLQERKVLENFQNQLLINLTYLQEKIKQIGKFQVLNNF